MSREDCAVDMCAYKCKQARGTRSRQPPRTGRDMFGRFACVGGGGAGVAETFATWTSLQADRDQPALAIGFVGATSAGKSWLV